MDKLLLYPSGVSGTEPRGRVIPVDFSSSRGTDALEKYAGERRLHSDVQAWLEGYQPMEGHVAFLIDALGSDSYGANINGDIFPADHLGHPGDYGYKTFEKFAYPYFHHINKGEQFSYGPKVKLATWLEDMERVQLVAWWSRERCGDLIPRLLDGELLDVSMGCRVPYDVCTYCGKKARKRSEYCDHLRLMMRTLMENGIRVGALNYFPKFFDISFVRRGAEKCSKFLMPLGVPFTSMLSKAASVNLPDVCRHLPSAELWEKVASAIGEDKMAEDKAAAIGKDADIDKEISSNLNSPDPETVKGTEVALEGMRRLRHCEHDLPRDLMDEVAEKHPLRSILATLMGARIMPKPREFQRIVLVSMGNKGLADQMESKGQVFDEHMQLSDEDKAPYRDHCNCTPRDVSPDIFKSLAPLLEARSGYTEPLTRRAIVIIKRAQMGMPPIFEEEKRNPIPVGALALGLAAFHGAFKDRASSGGIAEMGMAAKRNPVILAILAAMGVAAVEAHRQISLTDSHPFGSGGMVRTAAAGAMPLSMRLGGIPALYMYSDFQEAKRRRGEALNKAEQFLWRYPDAASLAWFFGAPSAYRSISGIGSSAGRLFKGASAAGGLASAIGDSAVGYGIWQSKALPLAFTGAVADTLLAKGLLSLLNDDEETGMMPQTVGGMPEPRRY
jgi:hypothetical protein